MKKLYLTLLFLLLTATFSYSQRTTETTRKAGELLSKGDSRAAVEVLDKAISEKKDLFEAYKMRSHINTTMGNLPAAVADLSEAIKIDSSDGELYARRAGLKTFLRDNSALEDYDFAIANGYKTDKSYLGRAMFYRGNGDIEKAEADYRAAYGLNPELARAVMGLASILEQKGKKDEAASILQSFIIAYEQRTNGKPPEIKTEAVKDSKIFKSEVDKKAKTQMVTGGSTVIVDNQGLSIEEVENTLNTAIVYGHLAMLQSENGSLDLAFKNIEKSLALNPNSHYTIGIRGKIYMERKDFQNALKDFDKSIKMMAEINNHYIDRGITHLILGNKEKAQADFDKYLERFPGGNKILEIRIAEAKQKFNFN